MVDRSRSADSGVEVVKARGDQFSLGKDFGDVTRTCLDPAPQSA